MLRRGRKKLGDILLKAELIKEEQLNKALEVQKQKGIQFGKVIVQLGYATQEEIIKALSEQLGIPYISLSDQQIDPSVISLVPENLARSIKLIPVSKIGNTLTVAMVNPLNVFAIDEVSMKTKMEVERAIYTEEEFGQTVDHYYGSSSSVDEVVQIIQDEEGLAEETMVEEMPQAKVESDDAPVIKLVNLVFSQAAKDEASDIRIEPEEDSLVIRFRIDGILHKVNYNKFFKGI